jgi:hypothetical protein
MQFSAFQQFPGDLLAAVESAAVKPFALFKDHVRPAIEARRQELEAMYDLVLGRPEIDPVLLTGVTILQTWNRVWKPCVAPVTVTVR